MPASETPVAELATPEKPTQKTCKVCDRPISARREMCVKCANAATAESDLGKTVKPPNTKDARESRKAGSDFENWLAVGQLMLLANGDEYCAKLLAECGPPMAQSMVQICEDFPMIRKLISGSDKWAAVAALIFQMSKLGVGIAVHHGAIQHSRAVAVLGIPDPNAAATIHAA